MSPLKANNLYILLICIWYHSSITSNNTVFFKSCEFQATSDSKKRLQDADQSKRTHWIVWKSHSRTVDQVHHRHASHQNCERQFSDGSCKANQRDLLWRKKKPEQVERKTIYSKQTFIYACYYISLEQYQWSNHWW